MFGDEKHDYHKIVGQGKVMGHRVRVDFEHDTDNPGEYHAGFSVYGHNGMPSQSRGLVTNPMAAAAIGHSVASTVHDFVNTHKPRAIHMIPTDSNRKVEGKKDDKYAKLAKHLASAFGGKHEEHVGSVGNMHIVRFPGHEI